MHGLFGQKNRFYWGVILLCLAFQVIIAVVRRHPDLVETYYSRAFYPAFSYLSIVSFSWIPFSFGDLFYAFAVLLLLYLLYLIAIKTWRKRGSDALRHVLQLVALVLFLHSYFYLNWGLNYYRVPLAEQLELHTETITSDKHLQVLDRYILITNKTRENIDISELSKRGVRRDLQEWLRQDTVFQDILSQSQIHGKAPISSTLASYFTVSGYFNPFTQEAQINQRIPLVSYPFVTIHELAHQMGIGFEDECNFIAFRKLVHHEDDWYRYSAYYEATQYLLHPLRNNRALFEEYYNKLSDKVQQDMADERAFWQKYRGWLDRVSGAFYDQYLKANNQPEGMERYSMMAKLVIAWELSKEGETDITDNKKY